LLFGLMTQESGGDVHAISHSGAAGPLQFMPAAAMRYGLSRVGSFDERFDPRREAQAAAAYMSESLGDLHGDFTLAVASYNAGDGLLRQLAAANPNAGFWARPIHSAVPSETRGFVPRVLAAAWLFAHPERYGLSFPRVDTALTPLRLTQPIALNGLASCLGSGTRALAPHRVTLWNLNPRLDPASILPGGTTVYVPSSMADGYPSRCVRNPNVLLAQNGPAQQTVVPPPHAIPAFAPTAAPASGRLIQTALRTYTVRAGDTLYSISRRFGCQSATALARANDLGSARDIDVGQPLELTGCEAS
ncbi:MAG TPA: transglycosylase SLT domain-containing protein, partial [Nevskiaceae bacterium]